MKFNHALAITALTLLAGAAYAGLVQPAIVEVDLANGVAFGDQLTARTSPGDTQFIGCGTRNTDDGSGFTFRWGFCQAHDAAGDEITCFTQNANLLDDMRATSAYAFITFGWIDDPGTGLGDFECIHVGFSTQSFYLPKK